MDLKEYFSDLHKVESKLETRFPEGEVFVTSLYHREKNSKPGKTISANHRNAARVITDQTHREATSDEIKEFLELQERNRISAVRSEQLKKQQYFVVVDQNQPSTAGVLGRQESDD